MTTARDIAAELESNVLKGNRAANWARKEIRGCTRALAGVGDRDGFA